VDGEREDEMSKVAFCFPGQGSLEEGMGREIALAVPEAMEVYRVGSEVSGLDLQKLCFESPIEDLVKTEVQQPALVATSLAVLAALRARGIAPDYVVGHSVGEFAAIAAANSIDTSEAIGLVRARGLAMAEAARESDGTMAAILGLDDEVVEELCAEIEGVWPANYNCPGQIVVSGEEGAVEKLIHKATSLGARRAVKLKVSGAFHSPLVEKAAEMLRPAVERVRFADHADVREAPIRRRGALLRIDHPHEARAGIEVLAHLLQHVAAPVAWRQHLDRQVGREGDEPNRGAPVGETAHCDEAHVGRADVVGPVRIATGPAETDAGREYVAEPSLGHERPKPARQLHNHGLVAAARRAHAHLPVDALVLLPVPGCLEKLFVRDVS
jgi:[acyl-carrier-protein] S-malonyltransferase